MGALRCPFVRFFDERPRASEIPIVKRAPRCRTSETSSQCGGGLPKGFPHMVEANETGLPRAASPSPVAPTGRPGKARTAKRFAYRNAAISQATYLGITKLVLITCAEFADDNGIFWHSIRSLARACGLSVGATHKSVQELLRSGVLKLLRHGGPKKGSNKYQFVLLAIPAHPTVYELRPANVYHTNVHEANLGEERSFGERSGR